MRSIDPMDMAPTIGNYAHAVSVPGNSRMLFISGQIPATASGIVPEGFAAQAEAVWSNIGKILQDTGLSFGNLAKVTTFLSSKEYATENGEIRRKFLGAHRPALTVVVVDTLDPAWLLEIEAVAVG